MSPPKKAKIEPAAANGKGADLDVYNKDYLAKLGNAVSRVLHHPDMENMRYASPLIIGNGGHQEQFQEEHYAKALGSAGSKDKCSSQGSYACGGVVAWLNEMYAPVAGIPFNYEAVMRMANHNYKSPSNVDTADLRFTVAVPSTKSYNPLEHKGALLLADPVEPLHALWFAADQDLSRESDDENIGKKWSSVFQKATLVFKVLKNDIDSWYHQEQARQRSITRAATVQLSALQRIRQVCCVKEKLEQAKGAPMTAEEFHKSLERIEFSALSEPVTVGYIRAALDVHEKAFSNPEILNLVLSCEGATATASAPISRTLPWHLHLICRGCCNDNDEVLVTNVVAAGDVL